MIEKFHYRLLIDEWLDGWMDGWTGMELDRWMDGLTDECDAHVCLLISFGSTQIPIPDFCCQISYVNSI